MIVSAAAAPVIEETTARVESAGTLQGKAMFFNCFLPKLSARVSL